MTLTSPGCPVGPQIIRGVQTYISQAYPGLDAINVHVVWSPMWDPGMMSQEAKDQLGFLTGDRDQESGARDQKLGLCL